MSTIMNIDEIIAMPDHFGIYELPIDDIKKQLGIEIELKVRYMNYFGKTINNTTIEIWYAMDFYGEIEYPKNTGKIQTITLENTECLDKLKYLCSRQYVDDKKQQKYNEHMKSVKDFSDKYINLDEFKTFVENMTEEYFSDIFEDISFLNLNKLAEMGMARLIEKLFNYFSDYSDDHDWESNEDLLISFDYDMFYESYPPFKLFSQEMESLCKGEFPNGDCLCGHYLEELNRKYNKKLFAYMKKITSKLV